MQALASTGAAVATLGITWVAKGMLDRATADKKVCTKALEEIAKADKAELRRRGQWAGPGAGAATASARQITAAIWHARRVPHKMPSLERLWGSRPGCHRRRWSLYS